VLKWHANVLEEGCLGGVHERNLVVFVAAGNALEKPKEILLCTILDSQAAATGQQPHVLVPGELWQEEVQGNCQMLHD
jgi:hypothetical protein